MLESSKPHPESKLAGDKLVDYLNNLPDDGPEPEDETKIYSRPLTSRPIDNNGKE